MTPLVQIEDLNIQFTGGKSLATMKAERGR